MSAGVGGLCHAGKSLAVMAMSLLLQTNAGKAGGLKLLCCASALPSGVRKGELPGGHEQVAHGFDWRKVSAYLPSARQMTLFYAPDVAVPETEGHILQPQSPLQERNYGLWAGRLLQELPLPEQSLFVSDATFAPPEGESFVACYQRTTHWLAGVNQALPAAVVLARPAIVRNLLLRVLYPGEEAVGLGHAARVDVPPLSYSLLSCHAGRWRVGMLGAPA